MLYVVFGYYFLSYNNIVLMEPEVYKTPDECLKRISDLYIIHNHHSKFKCRSYGSN